MQTSKKTTQLIYFFFFLQFMSCDNPPSPISKEIVTSIDTVPNFSLKEINPRVAVGSPVDIVTYNNAEYRNLIKSELSTGESLWYARFREGWSGEKTFNFSKLNSNINWVTENGLTPTVHMLIGPDSYMPDWLIKGTWRKTELDSLLQNMIFNIMDSNDNKDKVAAWNVINELFNDDGTYRTEILWKQMGWEKDASGLVGQDNINAEHPIFIRKAFSYCRQKTNKKLELRDFDIESNNMTTENNKKHKAFYQLLKHMIKTKIPIDAVGIQGHLSVGHIQWQIDSTALKCTVEKFKALGLDVYITELDAGIENRAWTPILAQQQKQDYYDYIKQAIEGGATRISFWGVQDGADPDWLLKEHPLPWDENFNRKSAYYGVQQALKDTK